MTRWRASLAQRLAGLGAGIVELAGLADDDGPRSDDQIERMYVPLGMALARSRPPPGEGRGCFNSPLVGKLPRL